MVEAPSPPYIPAKYQGGYQATITRIVMHGTVSDCYCGGARAIASYFQDPTYVSSCHYVVDPCEVIQCVYDNTIAWHDGTNDNSIGVEMCDLVEGPLSRWDDGEHQDMLARTADLVRQLCLVYGVEMRWITPDQIRAGWSGICTHDDMSAAYPANSSHWDPGAWPADQFMALVQGGAEEEDDMRQDERDALFAILNQHTGSFTPGEYPGWASKVPGSDSKLTLNDFIRSIDAMVYDAAKEAATAVWYYTTVNRDGHEVPVLQELADAKTAATAAEAKATALTAAVAALSEDSGLTPERVEQIVRDAVKQNIEITGSVDITGQEQSNE